MYPYNNMQSNPMMIRGPQNEFIPSNPQGIPGNDERFFWAPFVVGGLAGTALGYGIANNNQLNNNNQGYYYGPAYYPYPTYVYPSQNTYYF